MTLIQERGDYLKAQGHLKQEDGKNGIVSNGFGEERSVQTPLGPVSTAVPQTRNRIGTLSEDGTLENFKSTIDNVKKKGVKRESKVHGLGDLLH